MIMDCGEWVVEPSISHLRESGVKDAVSLLGKAGFDVTWMALLPGVDDRS